MLPVNPLDVTNIYQLVALIVIMLPGIFGAIMAYKANTKSTVNGEKIADVHTVLNSRLTELIAATRLAAHAEGVAEGTATADAKRRP
jgi:hypothetical protein